MCCIKAVTRRKIHTYTGPFLMPEIVGIWSVRGLKEWEPWDRIGIIETEGVACFGCLCGSDVLFDISYPYWFTNLEYSTLIPPLCDILFSLGTDCLRTARRGRPSVSQTSRQELVYRNCSHLTPFSVIDAEFDTTAVAVSKRPDPNVLKIFLSSSSIKPI